MSLWHHRLHSRDPSWEPPWWVTVLTWGLLSWPKPVWLWRSWPLSCFPNWQDCGTQDFVTVGQLCIKRCPLHQPLRAATCHTCTLSLSPYHLQQSHVRAPGQEGQSVSISWMTPSRKARALRHFSGEAGDRGQTHLEEMLTFSLRWRPETGSGGGRAGTRC